MSLLKNGVVTFNTNKMKEETKRTFEGYKYARKLLKEGSLANVFQHTVKQKKIKDELIEEIKNGCGNKVDSNGDCWYISSQGNLRLCSSCSKALKYLEDEDD